MNNTTDNYPQDSSFVQTYSQESFIQGVNLLTKQNMVQGLCDVDPTPALDPAPAPAGPLQGNSLNFDFRGTVLGSSSQTQLVSISKFSWKSRKSVQSSQTNVTTISKQKLSQKDSQIKEFQKVDQENFTTANENQEKQDVGIFEFKKSERGSLIHADGKFWKEKVLEFQKIGTRDLDIVELKLQKSSDSYAQPRPAKTSGSFSSVRAKFSQVEKEEKQFDDFGEQKQAQNAASSSSFLRKERQEFNQLVRGSFVESTEDQFSSIQPIYVENSSDRRESSPSKVLQTASCDKKFNQLIRGSFADIPDKQFSSIQPDNFSSKSRKFFYNKVKPNKVVKEKTQFNTLVRGSFCDEKQLKTKFLDDDVGDDQVITVERSEFRRGSHIGDVQYCREPMDAADQSVVSCSIESKFGDKNIRGSANKFDSGCGLEISSPSSNSKDSEEQVFEVLNSYDLGNSEGNNVSQHGVSEGALEQVSQFNKGIVQVSDCDEVGNIRTKGSDIAEKFKRLYPVVKQQHQRQSSVEVPYLQKQGSYKRGAGKDEEESFEGRFDIFKQSGFDGLENEESMPDFSNIMPNIKYAVTI